MDQPDPQANADPTRFGIGEFTALPGTESRVHVAVAEPDTVNVGLVTGTRGAVLIDTGSTPDQGAELRRRAEDVAGVPVVGAVVTHAHHDHWFGLAAFDDVDTWGHDSLTEPPDQALLARAAELGLDPSQIRPPSRPLSIAAAVDLGGVRLEMLYLGPGHSGSDVMVLVHLGDSMRPQVVFAGDVIESAPGSDESVWYGTDSHPAEWGGSLDALTGLLTDTVQVVPGHGPSVDKEFVLDQRSRIMSIPFETERLINDGIAFEQARDKGQWMLPWANIEAGVRIGYAELEARGVVPRTRLPLTEADLD